jgi:16S rRNA G966 N2-methylase RsmD
MQILNQSYNLETLETLKPHPRNPNRGALQAIESSINHNGFYGAIICQTSTRHILAGEHRWKAARKNRASSIPVIWVDCDDQTAVKIMLADNRLTRLGADDPEILAGLLRELEQHKNLEGLGFTDSDLAAILEQSAKPFQPVREFPSIADNLEALQKKWGTEQGQLWSIPSKINPKQAHRVYCGDSTDPQSLRHLLGQQTPQMVFADPPYGISVVKKHGKISSSVVSYKPISGDQDTSIAERSVALCLQKYPKAIQVWWGGNYYTHVLHPSRCWLVWDKNNGESTFADGELAWTNQTGSLRIFKHTWAGVVTQSERYTDRFHPTQKPVALAAWVFERFGKKSDLIFDPFLGSGMSLIAAEQLERICYGIEYDPEYVAAILERCSLLGLEPTLATHSKPTPSKPHTKQK